MVTPSTEPAHSEKRWCSFLLHAGYLAHEEADNEAAVREATKKFQEKSRIKPSGIVDADTIEKAKQQGYPPFVAGPDVEDIRECRPYFLIPLLESAPANGSYAAYIARIKRYVNARQALSRKPITDIYILSHGWHRNLFAGISAYDRLMSRFIDLFGRGRLQPKDPAAFDPLFLTLHWHSDPGQDGWVDMSGRRHKDSFLDNVRARFIEPVQEEANFVNYFVHLQDILHIGTTVSYEGWLTNP